MQESGMIQALRQSQCTLRRRNLRESWPLFADSFSVTKKDTCMATGKRVVIKVMPHQAPCSVIINFRAWSAFAYQRQHNMQSLLRHRGAGRVPLKLRKRSGGRRRKPFWQSSNAGSQRSGLPATRKKSAAGRQLAQMER
mmetsp:Transcript_55487/g.123957  ORF Transcript_55487/g.123957 Transcript_55487/m.123957 type:complete len:139 (+) Transcript_55487:84-500(+)